jgi:hypothetical protein
MSKNAVRPADNIKIIMCGESPMGSGTHYLKYKANCLAYKVKARLRDESSKQNLLLYYERNVPENAKMISSLTAV